MAAEESRIRMNYSAEVEAEINRQINLELSASYLYMAVGVFFARDDQALHGFAKFFQVPYTGLRGFESLCGLKMLKEF